MSGSRIPTAVAAALAAAAAIPATAHAQSATSIAAALRADPVYADARAKPTLSAAQAGRVRLAILEQDLGRIKIAVVTARTAGSEGGVRGLADAIDSRLRTPGTLLVLAGESAWVTTSYPNPQAAVAAVRRAFAGDRPLAVQLVAAVDGIARVDPGPSGDLERTAPGVPREIKDATDDVLDTVKLVFWIVGALIALPFLIGLLLIVRAVWRGRRGSREAMEDDRTDTRDQLVALGDEIRELDAQGGAFEGDPVGQAAYEKALGAYERADRLLPQANSPRRLNRVRTAISEGHRQIAAARQRLGAAAPTATPPAPTHDNLRDEANKAFGRED